MAAAVTPTRMKPPLPKNPPVLLMRRGVTLVELAVVISVLLLLLTFLFPAAGAWKRGSDRAQCIMNIRQVQMGVRSFSNLAGLEDGSDVSMAVPPLVLQDEIIGPAKFVETPPRCPSTGTYSYGGNVIPPLGSLYMDCSLAGPAGHVPDSYNNW